MSYESRVFAFSSLRRALALYLITSTLGCSLVNQKLDPNVFYKRDIRLEINGEKFEGVAVPKKSATYHIKVKARGVIDMIVVRSCHREFQFEEPDNGWFSSGKNFEFDYKPIKGIEDGPGCLLDIGTYEKDKGRHGWATIDFESELPAIPAKLDCNGSTWNESSVSICQARSGTIQKIIFQERMKVSPDAGQCDILESSDEKEYQYVMPLGECIYFFGDEEGKFHRHTTIGYDGILVRKVGE